MGSSGTGVRGGFELCGCWKLSLGPLEGQQRLLTTVIAICNSHPERCEVVSSLISVVIHCINYHSNLTKSNLEKEGLFWLTGCRYSPSHREGWVLAV